MLARVSRFVLAVVIAITLPNLAFAQVESGGGDGDDSDPEECGRFWALGCSNGRHAMVQPLGGVEKMGYHSLCKTCLDWDPVLEVYYEVDWEECHPEDCPLLIARNDSRVRDAYQSAITAAKANDVSALLLLASSAAGRIAYNESRNSVQVLNCDGTAVIANLAVPASLSTEAVSTLPDVEASMAEIAAEQQPARQYQLAIVPIGLALGILPISFVRALRRRRN